MKASELIEAVARGLYESVNGEDSWDPDELHVRELSAFYGLAHAALKTIDDHGLRIARLDVIEMQQGRSKDRSRNS